MYATPNLCASSRALCRTCRAGSVLRMRTGTPRPGMNTSSFCFASAAHGMPAPAFRSAPSAELSCPRPPSTSTRSGISDFSRDRRRYLRPTISAIMAKSSLPDTVFMRNRLYPDLSGLPSISLDMAPTANSSPWFDTSKHSIVLGSEGRRRRSCRRARAGSAPPFERIRAMLRMTRAIISASGPPRGTLMDTSWPALSESALARAPAFSGRLLTSTRAGMGRVV